MHDTMQLSAAGQARRQAMRQLLVTAVVRRRRWRRAAEGTLAAMLLGATGLWLASHQGSAPATRPEVRGPSVAAAAPLVAVFGDDHSVLARLSIGNAPGTVQFVDDTQLLMLLQQDGQPSGMVRSGGRVEVVPRVGEDWLLQP